jgi:phosphohistidine phosphatase SixA
MPKRILVLRHAHFNPQTLAYTEPKQRCLSPEGLKQAEQVARQIADAGEYVPPVILHGPATRVVQTAKALRKAFKNAGHDIRLKEDATLDEDGLGAQAAFDSFRATDNSQDLIVAVTHQHIVRGIALLSGKYIRPNAPGYACAYVLESDAPDWNSFEKPRIKQIFTP